MAAAAAAIGITAVVVSMNAAPTERLEVRRPVKPVVSSTVQPATVKPSPASSGEVSPTPGVTARPSVVATSVGAEHKEEAPSSESSAASDSMASRELPLPRKEGRQDGRQDSARRGAAAKDGRRRDVNARSSVQQDSPSRTPPSRAAGRSARPAATNHSYGEARRMVLEAKRVDGARGGRMMAELLELGEAGDPARISDVYRRARALVDAR